MKPVANARVRDYIITSIRENILSGEFPAGVRLAQEELAEQLGVSRIPVREALQILEEQGFLERLPSRHMVVVEISEQQLHQIFQIIGVMQNQLGQYICQGENHKLFLEELGRWDALNAMEFHRCFLQFLNNPYLSHQFDTMLDSYVEYVCKRLEKNRKSSLEILVKIRDAYVAGKEQKAAGLFEQYYGLLEEELTEERKSHS